MPNMDKFLRDLGGITQNNHVPRKGFRPERLKEIMNPVPKILSTSIDPKNMQERLWLATKWRPRIQNPNMLKLRPKGKTLKRQTPRKMCNIGFYNGTPNSVKTFSPLRKGRLQMSSLVECIHHRKMGRKPCIIQP